MATVTLKGKFITARILRREDLTPDLWKIWLQTDQPFSFKPGQYCTIGAEGIERPYSIVSSPLEEEIEIFIELVPKSEGGNLTPVLYKYDEGKEVTLRPRAKGVFLFKPERKKHLMFATVTGVAPYVSMLRTLDRSGEIAKNEFHILEGASYIDEFGYAEELSRCAAKHDNVYFVPSVSRPSEKRNKGWNGQVGRINSIAYEYVTKRRLKPEDTVVYACGHPQMIENVKEQFAGTDFLFEEERFWKD